MSNIRRSRGYGFEHTLVEKFNKSSGWQARRLGGSSTGLPDVVATNNTYGILLAIECKSGASDALYVPQDQLERCIKICNMFDFYKSKHVILAFKFMSKKRIVKKGEKLYERRKLIKYFKVADDIMHMYNASGVKLPVLKCTYQGKMYSLRSNEEDGLGGEINLPDLQVRDLVL